MRKLSLKALIPPLALFVCLNFAQARLNAQEAYKIDEVESPRCDLSEVPPIDPPPWGKFAGALLNNPMFRGAIVVYGLEGHAMRYARNVRARFNNFVGVAAERLVTIYGGHAENLRMELWIIPQGAAEPKSDFIEDTKNARQFDIYHYWIAEYCGADRPPALAEFAKALKQRSSWQGYIIVRPHRNRRGIRIGDEGWDVDGYISRQQTLRRAAKDKIYLVRKFHLSPTRVKAMIGDNAEWTHAELWLVPPGAKLPSAKAKSSTRQK